MKTWKSVLILVLGSTSAWAQSPTDSLLIDADRKEIIERARAEALAREAHKGQERLNQRKKALAQQINEIRRRTADQQALQAKYASQIQAMDNENRSLQEKQAQLAREVEIFEQQGRAQEAEALRAKTQLDATRAKFQEISGDLNRRRADIKNKIEDNRARIAEWSNQLTSVQNEIARSDLMRIDYEKNLASLEMQTSDLDRKLQEATAERNLMVQDLESAKVRQEKMASQYNALSEELKRTVAEKEKLRADQKKLEADYAADTKRMEARTKEIETARSEIAKERLSFSVDQRNTEELLRQLREKNEEIELALADEAADTSQAKLALLKSREELTKQVAAGSRLLTTEVKVISLPEKKVAGSTKSNFMALPEKVKVAVVETKPTPEPEALPEGMMAKKSKDREPAKAGGTANWKLSRLCNLYESANMTSTKQKKLYTGSEVTAEEGEGKFMKVVDSTGMSGFVLKSCGGYK